MAREGHFMVIRLDYDKFRDLAKQHGVDRLPTYFIVEEGEIVYRTGSIQNILNYESQLQ